MNFNTGAWKKTNKKYGTYVVLFNCLGGSGIHFQRRNPWQRYAIQTHYTVCLPFSLIPDPFIIRCFFKGLTCCQIYFSKVINMHGRIQFKVRHSAITLFSRGYLFYRFKVQGLRFFPYTLYLAPCTGILNMIPFRKRSWPRLTMLTDSEKIKPCIHLLTLLIFVNNC